MATVLFLIHLQNPDADEPSRDEIRPKDEAEKPKENELKVQDKDEEDVAQSSSQELATDAEQQLQASILSEQHETITFKAKEEQTKIIIRVDHDDSEKEPQEKELADATSQDSAPSRRSLARILSYDIIKVVESILKENKIERVTWQLTPDERMWQVIFPVEGSKADLMLNRFLEAGIGSNSYTSVSVIPIAVNFPSMLHQSDNDDLLSSEFIQSVKSRLTVAQVISNVRGGSQLTFDYLVLIVMASWIAAIGLVENSSVLLVASMLVSPLMGPILGGTFGIVLKYKPLYKVGILNELFGLSICVAAENADVSRTQGVRHMIYMIFGSFLGFIFGLITLLVPDWSKVTEEMTSRGDLRSLYVGLLVAIPSGAGVALSILGGNAGSLVGVAISASLLPPAVNAGMCWAYALFIAIRNSASSDIQRTLNSTNSTPVTLGRLEGYGDKELVNLGAISLTLTIINIVVIFVMGVLILWVKEVAPKTGTAVTKSFWKKDLKETRDFLNRCPTDTVNKNSFGDIVYEDIIKVKDISPWVKDLIHSIQNESSYQTIVKSLPGKHYPSASLDLLKKKLSQEDKTSRFGVSKAYNQSSTSFTSRFAVTNLDESDNILQKDSTNDIQRNDSQKLGGSVSQRTPLLAAENTQDSTV